MVLRKATPALGKRKLLKNLKLECLFLVILEFYECKFKSLN